MLQGLHIHHYIEPLTLKQSVVVIYLIGEGHTEAYATAAAWRRVHPYTLDLFLDLLDKLSHLGLGRSCNAYIFL